MYLHHKDVCAKLSCLLSGQLQIKQIDECFSEFSTTNYNQQCFYWPHSTGLNESINLAAETSKTGLQEVRSSLQAGVTGAILFSCSTLMHSK